MQLYINLGDLYTVMKKYDKAEKYYNRCLKVNSKYNHYALSKLGAINYYNNEYDKALSNFEKALEEIEVVEELTDKQKIKQAYHSSLGRVCEDKNDYKNAIKYYKKAIKLITNDINYKKLISFYNTIILRCYVKLEEYEEAIKYLKLDDQEYIFNYLSINGLFFIRKNLIDAKKYEDNIKEEIDKLIISKKLKSFGYESKENEEIFKLAKVIEEILVSYLFNNEIKLIHYTKKELVHKLFCKKEKKKLRLNNSAYMNDPNEGELLKKMLISLDNNDDNKIKNIVDKIYKDKYIDDVRKIIPKGNGIYLTSFSKAIDKLPMWISYTEDASGIGLVLDNNFFQLETGIDIDNEDINIDSDVKKTYRMIYFLDVKYIDKNNLKSELNTEENIELKLRLEEINNLLIKIEKNDKLNDNIKIVKELLDSIRFIFKDIQYDYEEEVRIIQIENNSDNIKYDENIGRYYINLEKDLDSCSEVILGVKCKSKMNLAEYIYNNSRNKNINVTISSAEYN